MVVGRFDHLHHWVPSLENAVAAYTQAGFPIVLGGVHPGRGTHNAQWETAPHFVELMAVHDAVEAAQGWRGAWPQIANILSRGGGAGRFAVEVDDLTPVVARLHSLGVPVRDPIIGSIKHPDGSVGTWSLAPLLDAPPWAPFFTNYGDTKEARARGRHRAASRWRISTLTIATPKPLESASWLARVVDGEVAGDRVDVGGVAFAFTRGEADRITHVGLNGPGVPAVSIHGLVFTSA